MMTSTRLHACTHAVLPSARIILPYASIMYKTWYVTGCCILAASALISSKPISKPSPSPGLNILHCEMNCTSPILINLRRIPVAVE
eukprot:IDg13533t1